MPDKHTITVLYDAAEDVEKAKAEKEERPFPLAYAQVVDALEKRGYTVSVANNGREALTILGDAAPGWFACALMDVQMPEMGGFECTTLIRDHEQISGRHLPIIAMTAHAMKGDDARCLAAGMDAYLSKPIDQVDLFDVIERQLRASRVSGEGRT